MSKNGIFEGLKNTLEEIEANTSTFFWRLVMHIGVCNFLGAYEQLGRSLGYKGGPKIPPKNSQKLLKRI